MIDLAYASNFCKRVSIDTFAYHDTCGRLREVGYRYRIMLLCIYIHVANTHYSWCTEFFMSCIHRRFIYKEHSHYTS